MPYIGVDIAAQAMPLSAEPVQCTAAASYGMYYGMKVEVTMEKIQVPLFKWKLSVSGSLLPRAKMFDLLKKVRASKPQICAYTSSNAARPLRTRHRSPKAAGA